MDTFELPRRWCPLYSDGLLLEAVDWDQRFKLPSPSLMGLVGPKPSAGRLDTFSDNTPRPVGVTAPGGFAIRVREPDLDEREEGLFGGGPGGSDEKGPDGRRK
jgi:hypothetical protein